MLAQREVHFIVHSLKDLPTTLPDGMCVAAMCEREDPRDAVIFHPRFPRDTTLASLPAGSYVGTSSNRRIVRIRFTVRRLTAMT